jgi:hypothetical protein
VNVDGDVEEDDVDEEPEQSSKEGDSVPEDSDTEYVEVRFISEVPEFRGTDLDVYGPFDEGEIVEIPKDNADILVNRGNAEFVENEESQTDTSEDDLEEEIEPVAPGEEWLCDCGQLNEEDRTVCRNPSCTKNYDEVSDEESE